MFYINVYWLMKHGNLYIKVMTCSFGVILAVIIRERAQKMADVGNDNKDL